MFGYRQDDPAARPHLSIDQRDSAPGAPKSVVVDDAFDWGDDAPARHPLAQHHHLRDPRPRPDQAPPRSPARAPRHLRRPRAPGRHQAPDLARRHGGAAPPRPRVHRRRLPRRPRPPQLLGLQHARLLRARAALQPMAARAPGAQVAEFKAMVKALHAAGIEVILDVVYNHTAEGNHLGPTLSLRGIDNATYYWLMPDARYYLDFTGTGNSVKASNPEAARLIVDSLRYWVAEMHVDGFRFDLCADARSRRAGRIPARRAAVPDHRAGSRALSRQADRRAVGRGPRRLPGRQLSVSVPRAERALPRRRPALLEGGRQPRVGARLPADRIRRSVSGRAAPPAGERQLRHRARRLHAARPGQLQRQAQRGERRAQPGRLGRQPVVEPRRRGRDRRSRRSSRCATGRCGTCWRRCSCRRACRCCWAATSWGAPSAATTTPTARTTRSPGTTGASTIGGAGCWSSRGA